MKISASFLGVKHIPKVLTELNVTDVDYIHVDVMDGKYVKNKTMSFSELSLISNYTRKRLDVHLMVEDVKSYIDSFIPYEPNIITFHLEKLGQ